jgi:cyclic pyranopterin phosphate synthase
MLVDPFGRAITYLRISLTDRCNLRCAYCMPAGGLDWLPQSNMLTDDEIVRIVRAAAGLGITKIRLTGGEPLVRPGVLELVNKISSIPEIRDIGLTTNGILLEMMTHSLAKAGLKRVNISLDTLKPELFKRIARYGSFEQVWQGVLAAEHAGLTPIKLNAVIIRGVNDDEMLDLASLSLSHPWHVRFIELMPIGNAQDWGEGFPSPQDRYLSVQEMRTRLEALGMVPANMDSDNGPARTFRIPGALGTIGFISPLGEHFCQNCNRLRLTADGKLRACLVMPGEISLREGLRSSQPLDAFFLQAVAQKPGQHNLIAAIPAQSELGMSQIGG